MPDVESLDLRFQVRVARGVDFSLTQDDILDRVALLAPRDVVELFRISSLLQVAGSFLVYAIVKSFE